MIASEFSNLDLLMLVAIFVLLIALIFLSVAEMGLSRMSQSACHLVGRTGAQVR